MHHFGDLRFRTRISISAAAVCAMLAAGTAAIGHEGASGVMKERMDAMDAMADALQDVAAMVRGKRSYEPDAAVVAAETIAGHAGELVDPFPEGTDHDPSRAEAAIWTDSDGFEEAADALIRASETLKTAAAAGKADLAQGLQQVGAACGGCHEDYRQPES